jgi:hypothetical protein
MSGADGKVRQVAKIIGGGADLIRVPQRRAEQSLVIRLKRDDPLTLGEHETAERHHGLAAHGLADDGEGLLSDRLIGGDTVRRVEEALVDPRARHETVDLDRVRALDLDRVKFLVFDHEV